MRKGQKAKVLNNKQTNHYFSPGTIVRFFKADTELNADGIEEYNGFFIFIGLNGKNLRLVQTLHPFEFVWIIED